jgi:hypothetical protein
VWVAPGTLLGPEGSGASSVAFLGRSRHQRAPPLLGARGVGGGFRFGPGPGSYRIPSVGVGGR